MAELKRLTCWSIKNWNAHFLELEKIKLMDIENLPLNQNFFSMYPEKGTQPVIDIRKGHGEFTLRSGWVELGRFFTF